MRDHLTAEDDNDSKVGRRAVVRTGVWAVPVVAVAAASPAFAACSGNSDLSTSKGVGSKPSNKNYKAVVTLKNTGGTTTGLQLQVTGADISTVTIAGWSKTGTTWVPTNQVACNGSQVVTVLIATGNNSSHTFSLNFTTTNSGAFPFGFTA